MNIFISLSVIFWSLFPSLLSYTQDSPLPNKVHLENLVVNGDFSNGTTSWFTINPVNMSLTVSNNILSFTPTQQYGAVYFTFTPVINTQYYFSAYVKTDSKLVGLLDRFSSPTTPVINDESGLGTFAYISSLSTATSATAQSFRISDFRSSLWTEIQVKNVVLYNISQMKLNGVKVDNGTLFSSMTNADIKTQLDTWVSQIPNGYNSSYYLSTSINDNYKWFSTGFVEKTGERDFIDYLGFFVWLAVPPISIYLLYKLMKGVIYE